MKCDYCKNEILYLKESEGQTGLYCKSCGRWLRWVDKAEKQKVADEIERQKREIRIDGANVEKVKETLKVYKKKLETLNSELQYFKDRNDKKQITSEIEKAAMYEKVLKMKELNAKIAAYNEILMTLRL